MKINACSLIHPISNYDFFGKSYKNTLFYLYYQIKLERRLSFKQPVEIFSPGT